MLQKLFCLSIHSNIHMAILYKSFIYTVEGDSSSQSRLAGLTNNVTLDLCSAYSICSPRDIVKVSINELSRFDSTTKLRYPMA